jgi:hypothetical protein
MGWIGWISTVAAVGLNLLAIAALVLSRGEPVAVVSSWARRIGWLALAFVLLATTAFVVLGWIGIGNMNAADPSMRAMMLARVISDGMNCFCLGSTGALLPVVAALWLARKARAQGHTPTAP